MLVGQDAAVGIDDESAAGATARAVSPRSVGPIEPIRRKTGPAPAVLVAASGGRIDVDDGGIDFLHHVRKIHESR